MTVALLHEYFVPPHSRANRNITANEANKMNPVGSRSRSLLRKGWDLASFWFFVLGILIARSRIAAAPPKGRLI